MAGGAFLSSAIQVLIDLLVSSDFIRFFRDRDYDVSLLKQLELKLLHLNKMVDDAEDKQIHDRSVKYWLDDLKDTVYDAEDVLDEIATMALRRKVEAEFQSGPNLVKSLISTVTSLFDRGVDSGLEKIVKKLDHLEKAKDVLGLREVAGPIRSQISLPTSSLVDESGVYGRDNDKEDIINLLLSDGESSNKVDVIPIVGMGGVGKTTLAQLVYNDDRLDVHFAKKAWVCVSDVFDVLKITRTLVEAVTGRASDAKDLSFLQVKLKESLSGKKFLIVLDDVWNENYDNWMVLMAPFRFGARGSKIIVTTRSESVASIMQTVPIPGLQRLPEEDCWKLFSRYAFEEGECNADPNLVSIGKQIVRKCGGLPLAAKTLGGLLRSNRDVKDWINLLETAIWELPMEKSNILPALRLSYHHLPSHLKRCFAYCSIFIKDYEFNMEELVSIWKAEGFLEKPKNNMTVEEEGYQCFRELLSRSFFQKSNANVSLYVMHDLVHDLAQYVMGDFCYRLEDGNPHGIYEKLRHFSYVRGRFDSFDKLKVIKDAKCLRTYLPMDSKISGKQWLSKKLLDEILLGLRRLRLLSLSRYQIVELPYLIGNLIHLRFLDLSDTLISELPPSVCTLYNLETLLLSNCYLLTTLPAELVRLILLCRLDLSGTNLKEMPMQMSRLKDLQELTAFVVGKCSGSGINELKELHLLRGTISISGLQNVAGDSHAWEAKLREKKHLEKLALEWGSTTEDSQKERDVLDKLEPHTHLKHLRIKNYGGTTFPTWLGDQSFCNMVSLRLEKCENCFSLPPLGQLHSLKELTIARMSGITNVGIEFYGNSGSLSKPFQSLETLRFEDMSGWVDWCILDAGVFPQLQKLEVIRCPKLIGDLPKGHSLVRLKIKECPELVASLPRTTSIRELVLQKCQRLLLEGQDMSSLEIVKISSFASNFASELLTLTNLKQLKVSWCPKLVFPQCCCTSLERLSFYKCESLISLPLELFPKLRSLDISRCENFENLLSPNGIELQNLLLLDTLCIQFCDKMVSFPCGGLTAPNLSYLWVCNCKKLKALPEQMHTLLPSLQRLMVWNCPEIESFPEGGLPFKLHFLWIWNCKKLVGGRRDWGLQTLPYLATFTLEGESEDMVESFPEEGLLPSTITALEIGDLENLKSLNKSGLQLLGSLKVMRIRNCPQLISLPEEGLPISLSELLIQNCPLLKHRCRREKGNDWYKIAHIPFIDMDGEVIFDHVSRSTRVTRP